LTKTDRCAGALSWSRNQILVLHFYGHFLLTISLRRRRNSMCIYLFTVIMRENSCKLYQRIPGTFWSYYVFYYYWNLQLRYLQTNKDESKSHLNLVWTSEFCTMPFTATLSEMCVRSAFYFQKHLILATVLILCFLNVVVIVLTFSLISWQQC
jgi:hypothetical protein